MVYLKNKDFLAEIVRSKANDRLTKKAEDMFLLLAKRTIKKMRYASPVDGEDCMQTGLLMLFSNWRSFDPTKSNNAFAYFTEIFKRGIAKGYGELHYLKGDKERETRHISLSGINDGEGAYNL